MASTPKPKAKAPGAPKKPAAKAAPAKKTPAIVKAAVKAATKAAVKVAAKTGAGRPTDYREAYNEQARKLCLLGYTDKELAEFFSVSEQTLNAWKTAHPEFLESLRAGKEVADAEIAASLYQRALGYEHPEDDIRTVSDGGGTSSIVITPTIKRYPPDTKAAQIWLTNRQRHKWRDKQEVEHTVAPESPLASLLGSIAGKALAVKHDPDE